MILGNLCVNFSPFLSDVVSHEPEVEGKESGKNSTKMETDMEIIQEPSGE